MHKKFLIIIILSIYSLAVQAQDEINNRQDTVKSITDRISKQEEVADGDTSLYFNHLGISPDTVNSWKKQKAFAYAGYLDSLLRDKQDKKKVKQSYSSEPGWLDNFFAAAGTKIFFWILAAFFILFILYKLFLTKGVFKRNLATDKQDAGNIAEELFTTESDFDLLIRQAAGSGNYRLAVRYQYLKALHKLAAKNLVVMAADKTNYQYVKEISNPLYRNEFAALTLSYEYVWYGEFAIAENIYRKIESGFTGFNPKI